MSGHDELSALREENARLAALLDAHGIPWRPPSQASPSPPKSSRLTTNDKIALFRRLFRGRTDVYPVRWESKTTGKPDWLQTRRGLWLFAHLPAYS